MNSVNDFLMRPITRVSQAESRRYERDTTMLNHSEIERYIANDQSSQLEHHGYMEGMEKDGGVLIRLGNNTTVHRVKPTSKVIGYSNVKVIAKLEERKYSDKEIDDIINQALDGDELVGYNTSSWGRRNQIQIGSSKRIRHGVKITLDDLSSLCELHGEIRVDNERELMEEAKLKFPHLKDIIHHGFIPGDNNLVIVMGIAKITQAYSTMIKYRLKRHHGGAAAVRKKNPKLELKQSIMKELNNIVQNYARLLQNGYCMVWYKTNGDMELIKSFRGNADNIRALLLANTGKRTHYNKPDIECIVLIKRAIWTIKQIKIQGLSTVKMGKDVDAAALKLLYKAFDRIKEFGVEHKETKRGV